MRATAIAFVLVCLGTASMARADSVEASSELQEDDGTRHSADLVVDGLLSTGWAEGEEGNGAGSWLELRLDRATDIVSVSVWPGNLSLGKRSVKEFGRPHTLTVTLSGGAGEDTVKTTRLEDGALVGAQRVDIPVRGRARTIRISMDEVYDGIVYNDTYIAEVALNFADGEPHPWVGKVFSWIKGEEGERPRATNLEEVARQQALVQAGGEGSREALAELMDQAGDGAPFIRKWVTRYVPIGFRIHAISPNEAAIEALLKLRDPTAIPALEQASLRVLGHDEDRLRGTVEMFYAYRELIGGANTNVPNWGQTGWAVGELRGHGEPLQLELDQGGQVFVADTGNSRLQRFTDTGRVNRTWGSGAPDITNIWLGGIRPWYVSGDAPGDVPGSFLNPVDVTIIPEKFDDGFAVLDASGRVQVFDGNGEVQATFKAPVHNNPFLPGVGGHAYLEYVRGKLIVTWSDSAYVYTLEGDELNRWDINDGVPSGCVVLKNGKLGLIFGQSLVMYSIDGFRHGSILGDTLGQGFEGWDVTLDQDRRLWAVTDDGWAVKYKKPGKVEYRVKISEYGVRLPRLAVRDDVIYLLHDDRIVVIDALELARLAELEAEGAP
ncbi:MAG: hypothetical protein JRJ84_01945 [Deltaproteobacteria bacterium]|nr:hypothetical protein [Deltaproteobacteria bacterium]